MTGIGRVVRLWARLTRVGLKRPGAGDMPSDARDRWWFLVGWKWATSTALANGWLPEREAVALEEYGDRLVREATRRGVR